MKFGDAVKGTDIQPRKRLYDSRYSDLVEACLALRVGQAIPVEASSVEIKTLDDHQKFRDRLGAAIRRGTEGSGMRFSFKMTDTGIAITRVRKQ